MRLTKPQQAILETFQNYDFCRILRIREPSGGHYAFQFWNKDDNESTYTYPNTRTVNALIRKGVLVETDNDSFELSEGE